MPGLRERIDTNKNNRIDISAQCNEINNFILDKKFGEQNLNELGKHLNNLGWNLDNLGIKDALKLYFTTPEWRRLNQGIKNKVSKNEPLSKKELSLLYLEMISWGGGAFGQMQMIPGDIKFDSRQSIDKMCNGKLIAYIRNKFQNPLYIGKKPKKIDLPTTTQKKKKVTINPLDRMNEAQTIGGSVNLPENIGEIKESDADFYCDRLIGWAEQNFSNDVVKAKRELEKRHRRKNDNEKYAYIKYDILLIAVEKYTEIVNKKHNPIIYQAGYENKEELESQIKLIEKFGEEMGNKYPGIDKILEKIKKFEEEVKKNEKKYFKDEQETKKAEQNFKGFNEYVETKSKEYKIDEIQNSLKKDPENKDEAQEYLKNMNLLFSFQEDITERSKIYGDSITKYQKYLKGNIDIQKKYGNIQQNLNTLQNYKQDLSRWESKINFKKYENYSNLLRNDPKIINGFKNISTLNNLILNSETKSTLIKEFKKIEYQQQIKQEGIDRFWNKIKNFSPEIYWTLTTFTGLWNGLIDATLGVSSSLGVLILSAIGGKDEITAQMDHKARFDNLFKIEQSSSQKDNVYNPETGEFNFHADNTVSTVASSISQMVTLISGGGAMAKGATKLFGVGESVAGRAGLFSMSFISQVGGNYQEAITNGLTGGEALGYSMLAASVQSGLELVSPNEVLLGKGSGIAKELIKNACKSGSKESLILLGKSFTKNVGIEIVEENFQESLQLMTGNLINMAANGTFGSELGADWSWKNFASTAIITTLTTGITTGTSTGLQMNNLNSQDKAKLIEHIKKDRGTFTEVTEMIDKAIAGKFKIPNVDVKQLEELKGILISSTGNTNTGNLNGETNNTGIIVNDAEDVNADDDIKVVKINGAEAVDVAEVVDIAEAVDVDNQNIEFGDPKEIMRVAKILSEFADFNVDNYVERFVNIPLYGKSEEYIRNISSFVKENLNKNNKNKLERGYLFENVRTIDNILNNSNFSLENIKKILQDEKINIKDIEYATKQNNKLNENEIKEEIKKFNILLNIESEEDLQRYITGEKIGSNISGNLEQYIEENGLSEDREQIENRYYGNFNQETQKYTMARDIGNSDHDIQLIQSIINQQNIKPRGLEHNSPYNLLKELHDKDHESFRLYSEYLLGKNITSLAGEYSMGSGGGYNNDFALYRHTRIGDGYQRNGSNSKYRIIGEFNQGDIIRSGELNQVADQTANWPESERITLGEVSNNNVSQIIDLETGKVVYDRNSGYVDPSLNNGIEPEGKRDYFNGKSQKIFKGDTTKAESNSKISDRILSEINEQNESEKLEELRKQITEQYKQSTGEDLQLTDEQILSILDAHEQDGKLGELTIGQLKVKVKKLSETITDSKVRRFLLEAGFCGSIFSKLFNKKTGTNNEIPVDALIVGDYQIGQIVNVPRSDGSITPGATIIDFSKGKYLVTRDQDGSTAKKWVSNEKLNEVNKANPEEESDIIMINPEEESDIIMIDPKEESDIIMIDPKEDSDIIMIDPKEDSDIINNQQSRGINTERKEMLEVKRSSDVVAIGDLHGEYKALKGNMEYAGLAREINGHLERTGGNKKVVFQGDILADRGTDGLRIIEEIHKLREQARKEGGDIDIIVGNHDDFMISYLTGRNGVHGKGLEIASVGQQGKGLTELAKFIGRKVGDFDSLSGTGIRQEIFQAMRNDPEGRMILEEICNMKLVSQVDDVLYIHTNPTAKMLEYLTKGNVQQNIKLLNQKYQGYLRNALLGEGNGNINLEEFNKISDIFLHTNNRPKYGSETGLEKYTEILKNSGINMISHGHNGGNGYRTKQIGGIIIVDTDYGYGHSGDYSGQHSVSVIKKEGGVNYMGDNVAYTNLDYSIGTEVLFVNNLGQESKVEVEAYNPATKEYTISDKEQGISREVTAESLRKVNNDNYFDGKLQKIFKGDTKKAEANSKTSDRILSEINEKNKSAKLEELRKEITTQYKQSTGEDLNLTDEQLLSILDAHEQDGELGKLSIGQLRVKVKILSETITDPKVRRFLLEAGFCGKESEIINEGKTNVERLEELGIDIPKTNREHFNKLKLDFKKLNKLKELGINIDANNVLRFNQIEFDSEKLQELKGLGVEINSKNFIYLNMLNFENTETLMKFQKLQKLGIEIYNNKVLEFINPNFEKLGKLKELGININANNVLRFNQTEFNFEKLGKLKEFGVNINAYNVIELNQTEFDSEKLGKLKEFGVNINAYNVIELNQIDENKLLKVKEIFDEFGIVVLDDALQWWRGYIKKYDNIKYLREIKQEISQKGIIIKSVNDIKMFLEILSNEPLSNRLTNKREYIERKNEFLQENETLSKDKFNELFKDGEDKGKYGIGNIHQTDLGFCYAYTGFELLKKSNFFETLIRTSMREKNNGREIKFPLGDPNGHTIKIKKSEIDSEYSFMDEEKQQQKNVSINSNSALGFKILEIAFIKEYLINPPTKINGIGLVKKAKNEYETTGDITVNGELLNLLEGGQTTEFMERILGNTINTYLTNSTVIIPLLGYINSGNIKIMLASTTNKGLPKTVDCTLKNGNIKQIHTNHAYSIERIYTSKNTSEKIVVIVNPRDTSKKIEITIDECLKVFNQAGVTTINVNKIFN